MYPSLYRCRCRYRYRYRYRYDINIVTGHFLKFGTTSIRVTETSVSSVWHQYRYRTLRYDRYHVYTSTGHFGKFGKIWYSRCRYRLSYRYRTLQ